MQEVTQPNDAPEDSIESSIALWRQSLTVVPLLLIAAAAGYFWVYLPATGQNTDANAIGNWGAFGDYIGGLMNPLVAFAAFYWLTQSVKLQKAELKKLNEEFAFTRKIQEDQYKNDLDRTLLAGIRELSDEVERNLNSCRIEAAEINKRREDFDSTYTDQDEIRLRKLEGQIHKDEILLKKCKLKQRALLIKYVESD